MTHFEVNWKQCLPCKVQPLDSRSRLWNLGNYIYRIMYLRFSVPKIEKRAIFWSSENIFFPFQFFLLFDFVNQKCFHVWSCINFSAYFSYFYCWNIDLGNGKPYWNVAFLEDSWWCSNTMNLGLGVSFFSWDLYFIKLFTHCNDLFPKNSRNQIYIFLCTYILTKWFVILPFLKVGIVLYIICTYKHRPLILFDTLVYFSW